MKTRNTQQGSLLLWGMLISVVLGIVLGVIQQTFTSSSKTTLEDGVVWKAQELANNLIEITKYFAFYERVVYVDSKGPLNHLDSSERSQNMITVLNRGIGLDKLDPYSLGKLCGSFGLKGESLATFKLGGVKVFCPYFTRVSQLTSKEMEVVLFEDWSSRGVVEKEAPGVYKVELDFTESLQEFNKSFISWTTLNEQEEYNLLFSKIKKAYVSLRYFTESSGFISLGNDRTLSIEARIEFESVLSSKSGIVESESFVIRPSIPKDYTLFFLYPTTSTYLATRKFSESVKLSGGSSIRGRAYFNGDLDVSLGTAPLFSEYTIFSGSIIPRPKISDESVLKTKFPKGLLTHFSSERWLFSGACGTGSSGTSIVNQSGYKCKNFFGNNLSMLDFFSLTPNSCTDASVVINSGAISIECGSSFNPACPIHCPGSPQISTISYPVKDLKIVGSHGFVVAPVAKVLLITSNSYLNGSLFGGHLDSSGQNATLLGAQSWQVGLPGFANQETLDSFSQSYLLSKAGITAPLMNMPIVLGVFSGVK